MLVEGKVVVLTGASGGIGSTLAFGLASNGADLVLAYHSNETKAREVAKHIEELSRQAVVVPVDVANPHDATTLVQSAVEQFGKVDVLINNAGIARRSPFLEITPQDFRRVFAVNVEGTFYCSQAAARVMVEQGAGRIINMSSIVAEQMTSSLVPYCASKAAISTLTKASALALAPHGVTVNAIAPGVVSTEPMKARLEHPGNREPIMQRTPMDSVVEPSDLIGPILFFASDLSKDITGEVLTIDHGYTLQGLEWDLSAETS